MENENNKDETEVIFEGGKGKKRSKTEGSKFRREVGEGNEPIISEELFYAAKEIVENRNKLKGS